MTYFDPLGGNRGLRELNNKAMLEDKQREMANVRRRNEIRGALQAQDDAPVSLLRRLLRRVRRMM